MSITPYSGSHQQTRTIRPTRRSVSGSFPLRNGDTVPYESMLERDFLARATFSTQVSTVVAQPAQIPFKTRDGRAFVYTPDFLIHFHLDQPRFGDCPSSVLVEIKPREQWTQNWRRWLPKWKAAWRYAQEQGWEFHILDESRIRDDALLNIQFLDRYKSMSFRTEVMDSVLQTVRHVGVVPVHHLLALHFPGPLRSQSISHIWHMIAARQLDCDIRQTLNEFLPVWVPSR